MTNSPTILLVRPQMGENIGAAARAMANFGLSQMDIVAPRDGWPNPRAADIAGKALPILDDARLHATTHDAVAECQFVLATTSRERTMNLPVLEPREAMAEAHARIARGEKVGILFGPERTGLENEDIACANAVVTVPVSPVHPSLNLGQAVVILGYEWWMLHAHAVAQTMPAREDTTATHKQLDGLLGHLEGELDKVNFWRIPEKKEVMWRNIRTGLMRAGFTSQEVATWRGIVKALVEGGR